jgi:thiosulfate sulfurtransferase
MAPEIDIHKAKQLLDAGQATFVDVRDPGSYSAAHIPGARHLTDQNVMQFVEGADRQRPVVVYCYHGNSSRGGAAFLQSKGFAEVYSMSGGFEAWRRVYPNEGGSGSK